MTSLDEAIFKINFIVAYIMDRVDQYTSAVSLSDLPRCFGTSISFEPHSDVQITPPDGLETHDIFRITPASGEQQITWGPEAAGEAGLALLKLWTDALKELKVRNDPRYTEAVRIIDREFPRAYEATNPGQQTYEVARPRPPIPPQPLPPKVPPGNARNGPWGWVAISTVVALGVVGALVIGSALRGGSGSTAASQSNAGGSTSTIIYQNALTSPDSAWAPDQYCFFAGDGLHLKPNKGCRSPVRGQGDIDVSVRMSQISGATTADNGIEVRRSGDPASLYEFDIDANGGWLFKVCIQGFDNCNTLASSSDPAIQTGLGATNTIEIRAVGSQFTLLVNGTQVGQVDDTSLASGDVYLDTDPTAECVFTDFVATRPS